jgi:hypothetical protein
MSIGVVLYLRTKPLNCFCSSSYDERNVFRLFNGDHYNVVLTVEERDRLDSFDYVCSYEQPLPNTLPLDSSNSQCIL